MEPVKEPVAADPAVPAETPTPIPPVQSTVVRDRLMASIVFHKDSIAAVETTLEVLKQHPEADAAFAKTFGIVAAK